MKNAICRRPEFSRCRNRAATSASVPTRARHRGQLGRRDRHPEQAHWQRVDRLRRVIAAIAPVPISVAIA